MQRLGESEKAKRMAIDPSASFSDRVKAYPENQKVYTEHFPTLIVPLANVR